MSRSSLHWIKQTKRISALILFIFLASCSNGRSPSDDYLDRLANVLNVDRPDTQPLYYPSFPEARNLGLNTPNNTISIREFLGLRQCKLHLMIAERNSQLGKVASASQRLKNDLDILTYGPSCLIKIENRTLKDKLAKYLDSKRKRMPATLAHALLTQSEYRKFWRTQMHEESYPDKLTSATTMTDLAYLSDFTAKVLNGDYRITKKEFTVVEESLGRLRYGDAGQLLSALSRQQQDLAAADAIIQKRLERPVCFNQKPTQQARHFQNVVNKFFIENVQLRSVKLNRRYQELKPAIERLESQILPHSNTSIKQWVSARQRQFEQALKSTKLHAKEVQKIFAQCGLIAGNSNI